MMPSIVRPVSTRTKCVILLGVLWFIIGIGVFSDHSLLNTPDKFPHMLLPSWFRGSLWCGTGLFAIYSSLTHYHKHAAIGLLTTAPLIRAASYFMAWGQSLFPGGKGGLHDGWYYGAIHLVVVCAVWFVLMMPSGVRLGGCSNRR